MKRWAWICAALAVAMATVQPAQAGRRVRRAVRTTAIVAAATGGTAAVVASAPRRTTVVAAGAVVSAPRTVTVAGAPDLTITEITTEGDALCVTVKNIGTAASPQTRLQIDLAKPGAGFFAGQTLRVVPLAINQAVRIRLRAAPVLGLEAQFRVDPRQEVAELNERNNDSALSFVEQQPTEPAVLESENVWGQPE